MPSASRRPLRRALVAALCVALIGAGAAGCETTQEKAAQQQAKAEHILRERAKRQHKKKREKAKKAAKQKKGQKGEKK